MQNSDKPTKEGKPPLYTLLEYFPEAIELTSIVGAWGDIKYGSKWKDDHPTNTDYYLNATLRHIAAHAKGKFYDDESKSLHLAHATYNLLAATQVQHGDNNVSSK